MKKNTINKSTAFVSLFLVLATILGGVTLYVSAQDMEDLPQWAQDAINDQVFEEDPDAAIGETDVKDIVYDTTKSSCGTKIAFFVAMEIEYENGTSVQETVPMASMQPLVEDVFVDLRTNGIGPAFRAEMKEYTECVENSTPESSPSREYDMSVIHEPCSKFTAVMYNALLAINRGLDYDDFYNSYSGSRVNFIETAYADVEDPMSFYAAQLFSSAQKGGDEHDLAKTAAHFSIRCMY